MRQVTGNWQDKIHRFFDKRPEREFFVGDASGSDLAEAARLLWLVGFASQPINSPGFRKPDLNPEQATAPIIVRRPDPAGGQHTCAVIVLDGGIALPPFPSNPDQRSRSQEGFGAFIWQAALETGRAGKSLKEALAATGAIKPGKA
jgi:hypothetical protein